MSSSCTCRPHSDVALGRGRRGWGTRRLSGLVFARQAHRADGGYSSRQPGVSSPAIIGPIALGSQQPLGLESVAA
eukprot:scaffold10374_cov121-Isochrysis_galbana.AAC.2